MNITLALFALSLLGADGPSNREAPDISYVVRVLKMNGLDWRGAFYSRLQPVATRVASACTSAEKSPDTANSVRSACR